MIRALVLLLLTSLVLLLAATFAWLNPGTVQLDLAFASVEILKSQAFVAALAIGWLVGVAGTAAYVLKLIGERRRLRKSLRLAEAEVANLRSAPVRDAV